MRYGLPETEFEPNNNDDMFYVQLIDSYPMYRMFLLVRNAKEAENSMASMRMDYRAARAYETTTNRLGGWMVMP